MGEQRRAKRLHPPVVPVVGPVGSAGPEVLVNRWTAPLACALQVALRYDVYEFAERLGAGWRTVADWQAKPEIVPKLRMQRALDAVLREADEEATIRFANLARGGPVVWVSDSVALEENGGDTNRGQVLRVMGGALAGAAFASLGDLGEAVERIAAGGSVDDRLVRSHERVAAWLASEYLTAGPGELLPVVGAEADRVLEALREPMSEARRARLDTVAVGVHAQAGLLAFWADQWGTGYRYLATGLDVAARSGSPTLHAQALSAFATLYSPIPRGGIGGDYDETVALLDQAADLAAGHASGLMLADVYTLRAAEHAHADKAELSKVDLEVAEQGLRLPVGPEQGFFSAAGLYADKQVHLEQVWSLASMAAGQLDDAEAALSRVLRTAARVGRQVMVLAGLAAVRIRAGEPEGACAALTEALDLAVAHGYTMLVQRIRGVRTRFPEPWAGLPCVVALDQRLRPPGGGRRHAAAVY
ncbi:MAG: hypothetical protein ACRDYA_05335 [Egibacteraceae bacterium]